jgi:pimeloyl-ACP methyl ester carboxylesterase
VANLTASLNAVPRSTRPVAAVVLALLVAAVCAVLGRGPLAASGQPATPSLATHACPSGLGAGWRCATATVPLDRQRRTGAVVHVAVALRHAPGPPRPAVLALAGGPGEAAIPGAHGFERLLAPLLANRDLLVVDVRGTGASDPIACPQIDSTSTWGAAAVATCAHALGAAAGHYGSEDVVDDLDDVRRLLGIPRLAVYGISYGTKTAVAYARRHPSTVDGLVLDSPIVEDTDPFYRRSATGSARVLANVCAEGGCPAHVDPVADLRALVRRARGGVLTAGRVTVTEASILQAVVAGGPRLRALPAALHAAARGDLAALARAVPARTPDLRAASWMSPRFSHTVYLATSCDDGNFPWSPRRTPAQRTTSARRYLDRLTDKAFAPFDRHVGEQYGETGICAPWPPAGRRPAPLPLPDVPALLLVGGDDDLAPLEGAREIAGELPQTRLVAVPGVGHGVLHRGGVAAGALRDFAKVLTDG